MTVKVHLYLVRHKFQTVDESDRMIEDDGYQRSSRSGGREERALVGEMRTQSETRNTHTPQNESINRFIKHTNPIH